MSFQKIDNGKFKEIKTEQIEVIYNLDELKANKNILESQLTEINNLLEEAKKLGIE